MRCWQAARLLAWMLPKPTNIASGIALGARKMRLAMELAEFDFRHRLQLSRAASFEELYCAGGVLLTNCRGAIPPIVLPIDEELWINDKTFDVIVTAMREKLGTNDRDSSE
jgi:hypothetical protein